MVQFIKEVAISAVSHAHQIRYLLSSFPITDWELVAHRVHPTQSIFQWIGLVVIWWIYNTNHLTVQILTNVHHIISAEDRN